MSLMAGDVNAGREANIFIIMDGERKRAGHAKGVQLNATFNKTAVRQLGARVDLQKVNGVSLTGSLTTFYLKSEFRKKAIEYIKGGPALYFDMEVYSEDPSSRSGRQSTMAKNCNLDEILLAYADAETDVLEETQNFTYEDVDMPETFNDIDY